MITFAYDCPHCGVKHGGFEIKTYYENDKFTNYSIFSLLATCNTCSSAIVGDLKVLDDSYAKGKLKELAIFYWQKIITIYRSYSMGAGSNFILIIRKLQKFPNIYPIR